MARASPRAGALEGRCTHVKLRTPLFRRPHAAEKLSQPSRIPPRRFRRRGRDGRRSPERLRRCPRDGPVRRRRRHLRDDARGGVRRHRRRIEPAAVPARRARTDDPSRARAVASSRVHIVRPTFVGDPGVRGAGGPEPRSPSPGTSTSSAWNAGFVGVECGSAVMFRRPRYAPPTSRRP